MKKFFSVLVALILLLVVTAVVAPFLIPVETYKSKVSALLEEKTGRKLALNGPISFVLLPNPHLKVEDAVLYNPAGFSREEMVRLKSLELTVSLSALLDGRVDVEHITLKEPDIWLERNRQGRANWEFGDSGGKSSNSADSAGASSVKLRGVDISNGTVVWKDAAANGEHHLSKLDLSVNLDGGSDDFSFRTIYASKETGEKPIGLKGKLKQSKDSINLSDAVFEVESIQGRGNVAIHWGSALPAVDASLVFGVLDLTPFVQSSAGPAGNAPAAANKGWSHEKMDFSALRSFALNLSLTADGIKAEKFKVGRVEGKVVVKNGQLVITLSKAELYNGTGAAIIGVNAASVPTLGFQASLKGVEAEPLLHDAADFDRLSGKLNAGFDVTARGNSQAEWVSALNGQGNFMFTDGAVKGINLAAMARNVKTAFLANATAEKTDFAELSGTIQAQQGILSNNDLAMKAPLLRLSGEGNVNLPTRAINYRLVPKISGTLEGQGGQADIAGIQVPILVTGSMDDPQFTPDLRGAVQEGLKNPEAVKDTIKGLKGNVGEQIKDVEKEVKGIRDFFKKPKAAPAQPAGVPAAPAPASPMPAPVPEVTSPVPWTP